MAATKGNCYLCGRLIGKSGFKRHIQASHPYQEENEQKCVLLKIEDAYSGQYWLYLDISTSATLRSLDSFLRDIWLECCGHMSEFYDARHMPVKMNAKMFQFPEGSTLYYEYDFGSTTELKISVAGWGRRPWQDNAVRLLGRNEPFHYVCQHCGKEADCICIDCAWKKENPFLCEACIPKHNHGDDMLLPVVNSPRMGVCGYCGERDVYAFDPEKYTM